MNKLTHGLMALAAVAIAPTPASASTSQMGTASGFTSISNGALLFNHNGSRTAVPACATSFAGRWAIDASTVAGQSMIAVMINAYNRGKQVYIAGTGTCSIWGDTETISYMVVQD